MPIDFIPRMVLNTNELKKHWAEIYYNKGCRGRKLQEVVHRKLLQRAKKLGVSLF